MALETVTTAYSARAKDYITLLGRIELAAVLDLALVKEWASHVEGPVLDVGCGPGQWTHYLNGLGVDAEGIDPVAEFIESAKATYPGARYRLGRGEDLGVESSSLGGILAWYSLIHIEPDRVGTILTEFARCLRPGGRLALGFFTGPKLEPFPHTVATAYSWPKESLTAQVEMAGFTVTHTESRTDKGSRPHGALLAQL